MTESDWLINIENSANIIVAALGQKMVDFVLQKYGAQSIEELSPCDYEAVFGEFYQYEVDLRD